MTLFQRSGGSDPPIPIPTDFVALATMDTDSGLTPNEFAKALAASYSPEPLPSPIAQALAVTTPQDPLPQSIIASILAYADDCCGLSADPWAIALATATEETPQLDPFAAALAAASPPDTANILSVTYGGTSANLSATGGANQVLQQSSVGAKITVGQLTYANIGSGVTAATATGLTISGGTLSGTTTLPGGGQITSDGKLGLGSTTPGATDTLLISTNVTGSTTQHAFNCSMVVQSDVTSAANSFRSFPTVANAAFTLTSLRHYFCAGLTVGGSATVTNQYGFSAASGLTAATNNYGFYSDIASAANRFNFYANGTAQNYFAGAVSIGTTTNPGTGHLLVSSTMKAGGFTVATLPTVGTAGRCTYVTDANATTFASTVAGGGANVVPVFDNGTNWIIA